MMLRMFILISDGTLPLPLAWIGPFLRAANGNLCLLGFGVSFLLPFLGKNSFLGRRVPCLNKFLCRSPRVDWAFSDIAGLVGFLRSIPRCAKILL
ncbi:hypothetical protein K1719_006361 [Acacia pycnantha]|nr:hypothetical protein K1719_006361 [Acacia pycnantha]